MDLIILFVGGLTCALGLVVGMFRPWRGLLLLWISGAIIGLLGRVPGLSIAYVTGSVAMGGAALLVDELIMRRWSSSHEDALQAGKKLMTCTLAALITAGVFLGPFLGVLVAGIVYTMGETYFTGIDRPESGLTWGVFYLGIRVASLLTTAALLTGRLLGLF